MTPHPENVHENTISPQSETQNTQNMSEIELEDYFNAMQKAVNEWKDSFKDYDINDYLYEEQENIIYGILEKFYLRIRTYKRRVPKQWKVKGLPTLRTLERNYFTEDSDMHLSDYEYIILDPMQKLIRQYEEQLNM